jgi:DNA polymerase-3 subunit epsilon
MGEIMQIVVGIDIETTGLKQTDGHRMVEFGAILYDLDTKKFLGKYVQRINPQRPIDPKAQAVHGISFEDVANMPTLEEVAPMIVRVLNSGNLHVAHNGKDFDMPFIRNELIRIGVDLEHRPLVDTMRQGKWATAMGKNPNLGELCFATGTNYDTSLAHGAEYDIEVMMQSFFVGHDKGFFKIEGEVAHEL